MRRRRLRRALLKAPRRRSAWPWLALSAIGFLLSLGVVVQVQAVPAEARTSETWYAYKQELSYDFTARVRELSRAS